MSETQHPEALVFVVSVATKNEKNKILKGDIYMVSVDSNYVLLRF